jgi:hypothetical protein
MLVIGLVVIALIPTVGLSLWLSKKFPGMGQPAALLGGRR